MANETKIVITAATAQAEAALAKLGSTAGGVTRSFFDLSGIAATLTGALSITAFAGIIKGGIDAADSLETLRFQTGTAVEELAGLKYAAEQNGVSLDLVAKAGNKLGGVMMDKPELFKKLGITATDSTEAMVQLADIFASMPEGIDKTNLAAELMGEKLGPQMVEFLSQGTESLRAYIDEGKRLIPISGEMARQAAQFNDQMDKMSTLAGGFGIQAANGILPAMNDIVELAIKGQQEYGTLYGILVAIGGAALKIGGVEINPEKRRDSRIDELMNQGRRLKQDIADPAGRGGLYDQAGFKAEAQAELDKVNAELKALVAEKNAQIAADGKSAEAKRMAAESARKVTAGDFATGGKNGKSEAERIREQEQQAIDSLQRQAAGYEKLSEVEQLRYDIAAGKFKGFEQEKLREMELLAQQIDLNKSNEELKKYTDKLADRAAARAQQRMEEEAKAVTDAQEKETKRAQQVWENFTQNVQRNFGDVLYNGLNGNFKDIGDGFKQMLLRMAADAAAANISQYLFGNVQGGGKSGGVLGNIFGGGSGASGTSGSPDVLGSIKNLFGGGRATGGPVSSGSLYRVNEVGPELLSMGGSDYLMMGGRGGFVKPLSPAGAGAQSGAVFQITSAPVINIDSRTDQAEVYKLVQNAVAHGNAQLVDRLQRQGALA